MNKHQYQLVCYLVLKRVAMDSSAISFLVILISVIMGSVEAKDVNPPLPTKDIAEFMKSSCSLTQYPELCVSSLSSYPGTLKPTLSEMAKASVDVSLISVRNASVWAADLKTRSDFLSRIERAALQNCILNFRDIREELRQSLEELKHLRRNTFDSQMDDVLSGMNAAFTNEDSCGNSLKLVDGNVKAMVTARVQNVHQLISNALELVSAMAATGVGENDIDM